MNSTVMSSFYTVTINSGRLETRLRPHAPYQAQAHYIAIAHSHI